MRIPVTLLFCASLVLASAVSGSSAELDIRIKGRPATGNVPPKPPQGDGDTVAVVGEATGETEFMVADQISTAVASGQEAGPNGEVALRVLALPGKGGIQTVRDVLGRRNVDFGIVPAPVLEAAARGDGMANLRKRIAYVAPLYVEEVHLVAKDFVRDVGDLSGATVSVGEEGGSTEFLAREVLTGLGVKVTEVNLDARASLAAVRDGRVAAAFVVSGKPVSTLAAAPAEGLHLIPLPEDRVPEGFVPSTLTHADYPGLVPEGRDVATYGVRNLLIGYNWPARSARGETGRTFVSILMYRLPELQVGTYHPKWREVNVAATVPGWSRLPAMQAWLANAKPLPDGPAGDADFEGFLRRTNTQVTGENRDALRKDYARWRGIAAGQATR